MGKKRTGRNSGAGKVRLQWALLLDGLRGLGWVVTVHRAFLVSYQTAAGRTGSVSAHPRGDGDWRYEVDRWMHVRSGKVAAVRRPKTYQGPASGCEITLMADEVEVVTEWLLRWIAAYDAGEALPDMPDGTPYPGGYVWTKAKEAHHDGRS